MLDHLDYGSRQGAAREFGSEGARNSNQIGGNLDTVEIVKELMAERDRLDRAIAALDGATTTTATVATPKPSSNGLSAPRKRHHLTAAGRKRLSMMMKKRWAEKRKKNSVGKK